MSKVKKIVIKTVEWYLQILKSRTLKRNPNANTDLLDRLSADKGLIAAYGLGILFAFQSCVALLTYFDEYRNISLVGAACALLLASIFHPKTRGRFEFIHLGLAKKMRWGIYFLLFIFAALGSSPSPERQREIDEVKQAREERERMEERESTRLEAEKNRQEEFYDKLGAPKLLYRCKGAAITKAIGATFGTYNRLLSRASEECGEDNVEILDKEE